MGKILIVDDDYHLRQGFKKILKEDGHAVYTASTGEAGIALLREHSPDLVFLDVCLPGINGLEAFRTIREIEPKTPVIVFTAFGTTETAIEATSLGAFDYVIKPFDIPAIMDLVKQAMDASRFMRSRVEIDGHPETAVSDAIIGKHSSMQELYKAIGRAAPTDATVLILGESGTGKELMARAIYHHSLRSNKSFLAINCVAIPETLLESELFGYEKGAFTGAFTRHVGKIEQANGGTVFFDEIGDMPISIQSKILRLLQEKSIERIGGRKPIPVDVRIIAATNRDLELALAKGNFREDLYYRLKVVTLCLPPLRDRLSDVPLLAEYFLARFSKEMNIKNPGITRESENMLKSYHWPGNIRELGNAIQKTLIFNHGSPITPQEIFQTIHDGNIKKNMSDQSVNEAIRQWIRETLISCPCENMFDCFMEQFAGIIIGEALSITGGNRTQAAKILGLSRPTMLSKIEKYKIMIETSVKSRKL
ncbi:sigma-54-dependent Fis family transcriptional regulator [bacterium]|nr:sigma-54-dependent Fis family transcriptional regulator [bacterium]